MGEGVGTRALRTILIVEDDPDIRTVARLALETVGSFEVRTSSSGEEGLEAAVHHRPDLILLDVMMPGMDGPTTLERLRDRPETRETPVVFLTAKVQADELERFRALGADDVIGKPFDPMTLADSVRGVWSRLRAQRAGTA